jgi:GntR family transcriptional regulator
VQEFRKDLAAQYIDAFLAQMESLGLTWQDIEAHVQRKYSLDKGEMSK